jgi:hypothetical protein
MTTPVITITQNRAIRRFYDSWNKHVNSPKPENYYASDQNRADDALKALITSLPNYDAATRKLVPLSEEEKLARMVTLADGDPTEAIEELDEVVREYYAAKSPLAKALALIGTLDALSDLVVYNTEYDPKTDSFID